MANGRHKKHEGLKPPAAQGKQIAGSAKLFSDVLRLNELKVGESYDSWVCDACRKMIALVQRPPNSSPLELSHTVLRIPCPHCGAQRLYPTSARRVRVYRGP
jgi:DNA-directed RNA polymerase subunit RPC12/RpoP